MNKKGFELAISTLVIIILGIFVLVGIIFALTDGFKKFNSSSTSLLQSVEGSAVKKACDLACKAENKITYCCQNFTIKKENVKCYDKRLEIDCPLDCGDFSCGK